MTINTKEKCPEEKVYIYFPTSLLIEGLEDQCNLKCNYLIPTGGKKKPLKAPKKEGKELDEVT